MCVVYLCCSHYTTCTSMNQSYPHHGCTWGLLCFCFHSTSVSTPMNIQLNVLHSHDVDNHGIKFQQNLPQGTVIFSHWKFLHSWIYIIYACYNLARKLNLISYNHGNHINNTVKPEYLAAIIIGGFSNMTIWQRNNLAISNTGISKDCDVFIWRRLILANF